MIEMVLTNTFSPYEDLSPLNKYVILPIASEKKMLLYYMHNLFISCTLIFLLYFIVYQWYPETSLTSFPFYSILNIYIIKTDERGLKRGPPIPSLSLYFGIYILLCKLSSLFSFIISSLQFRSV